jgi:hypothetical protein
MEYSGRTTRRHRVDLDAKANWPTAQAARACRLRDLSIGGAFVELGRLSLGTRIHLSFRLPILAAPLSLDAVVHWSTQQGVGVQFEAPRAWEVWVLWRYLESLAWGPRDDAGHEPPIEHGALSPSAPSVASGTGPVAEAIAGPIAELGAEAVTEPALPAVAFGEPPALPEVAAWSRRRRVVRTILSVKASIEDGRLRIDEAIDLPHGTRVAVVVFEDDAAGDHRRARLLQIVHDDAGDDETAVPAQAIPVAEL